MNLELVEYLENKGMDTTGINIIFNFLQNKTNDFDVVKSLDSIYDVFGYIEFSNEQIEMFITKNTSVLDFPKTEIIKIAYVLHNTGFIDELFNNQSFASNLKNYKRIFMRDLIAKNTGRYINCQNLNFLIASDKHAYGDRCKFAQDVSKIFRMEHISTDAELEALLDKCLIVDNQHISVENYINKKSCIFYNKYIGYKKRQSNKGTTK